MTTVVRPTASHGDQTPEVGIVNDWLASNGIHEHIPKEPPFQVDQTHIYYVGQTHIYYAKILETHPGVTVEDRMLPLSVPLTDEVRAAFAVLGVNGRPVRVRLDEEPNVHGAQ